MKFHRLIDALNSPQVIHIMRSLCVGYKRLARRMAAASHLYVSDMLISEFNLESHTRQSRKVSNMRDSR